MRPGDVPSRLLAISGAILRRDALISASYRLTGVLTVVAGLFSLWMLYFLARIFGDAPALRPYAGDYFRFAVVGTAVAALTRGGLAAVSRRVRESQLDGSLAYLLGTPAPGPWVVASLALYPLLMAILGAVVFISGSALLFGADYSAASFLPAVLAALAGSLASVGLGLFSSAMVLLLRRGDPVSWALESLSYLLSGVLYPVEVLPSSFQKAAQLLPATHTIAAVRAGLLRGASVGDVAGHLLALLAIAAVTVPLGLVATRLALTRLEREGSAGLG